MLLKSLLNRKKPMFWPMMIHSGKVSSGWYPCEDYPIWLDCVKKVIRKYRADADIVFWTYNWGWAPEEARVKLVKRLPTDISVEATFEMFEKWVYDGAVGRCDDYTLSFEGPPVRLWQLHRWVSLCMP